jgi:hypothetical protein
MNIQFRKYKIKDMEEIKRKNELQKKEDLKVFKSMPPVGYLWVWSELKFHQTFNGNKVFNIACT